MIQITPQMRILVAIEPCDFRKGIDGLPSSKSWTGQTNTIDRRADGRPRP